MNRDWTNTNIHKLVKPSGMMVDGDWIETKDQDPQGNVRLIQLSDIGDGVFKNKSNRFITEEKAEQLRCTFLEKDDILVARLPDPLGRCCIFPGLEIKAITSVDICIIRTPDKCDKHWLMYLVNSSDFRREIYRRRRGTTRIRISRNELARISFDIPPLVDQQKITEILSTWDKAIDLVEKQIKAKQKFKKTLMQQLLTGRLRFPEFGKPVDNCEIPEGWKSYKFPEIFKMVKRKNYEGIENVLTASGEVGLINQKEFFNKSVAGKNINDYYLLHNGEFAYNRSAMNGYPYGAIKRLDRYEKGVLSTLYFCFAIKKEIEVNSDFLTFYFEGRRLDRQLRMITQIGGRAHGLLNISNSDFKKIDLILPVVNEQKKIANLLIDFNSEISSLEAKLKRLKKQKCRLMQILLTGKLRVGL